MAGIGHNGGPELSGVAWRRHCWQAARARLLPVLPVEVVRLRVRRAAELGLDYKTYAGVRAACGRDVIGFLFSSNALRIDPTGRIPAPEAAQLAGLAGAAVRLAVVQGGAPSRLLLANPGLLDTVGPAPAPHARFGQIAADLRAIMGKLPGDGVVLVASDAPWEAEWLAAGKFGALLDAARYFKSAA